MQNKNFQFTISYKNNAKWPEENRKEKIKGNE